MIIYDVRVKVRDGTEISCDIYYPDKQSNTPVILFRTPYGKGSDSVMETATHFSSKGFIFVSCDVRGRGDSDGKFIPYFNEGADGYDLVEWASCINGCDGNVFTYGASYSARIQWLTAKTRPPHLRGMIGIVSPSDPFVEDPTGYPSPMTVSWLFSISGRVMQNTKYVAWDKIYRHLPLIDMDKSTGREIPFWKEYFLNSPASKFWEPLFYQRNFNDIDVPVMHISGWYDDEQIGAIINYTGMRSSSASQFSRDNQAIIMGPWPHNVNSSTKLGQIDFGPGSKIDLIGEEITWIRSVLSKTSQRSARGRIFLMGPNRWVNISDWPVEGSREEKFFLQSNHNANGPRSAGKLSPYEPDYFQSSDDFTYDPGDPVPFITEPTFSQIGGPDDYSEVEKRPDVLFYSTDQLSKEINLVGSVKAKIFVSSTAPDTDFTAKLVQIWPNGFAQRLVDGIVRIKYRNGMESEEYISPNDVVELSIDMWNTAVSIPPSHRIGLEISSSAFPKYSRNQNLRGNQSLTDKYVTANQRVYHGKKYPSCLILTVAPDILKEKQCADN